MTISIPNLSLVLLIGPSGSGKITFARRHFLPTEILSSDACRAMVSDNENDQTVTNDAFEVLRFIAARRLALGRLTVVDATNVQPEARKPLVELARQYHCLPVAIVLDLPERVCHERNQARADRDSGPHVIRNQKSQLRRSLKMLRKGGFRYVSVMETPEEVETTAVERVPLWTDRRTDLGPFDIILDGLIGHYVLDGGRLVVAHAGMKQEMQGRGSRTVWDFALYGETTGETDEFGLPVRHDWARDYRGPAMVVYGHTPVLEPEWLNRTVNIDTGAVFGGKLTALRYPEDEPVRRRPTLADLSAPQDVPVRDQRPSQIAGAPRRSLCLLPRSGCAPCRVRGKAYGFACRRRRLP